VPGLKPELHAGLNFICAIGVIVELTAVPAIYAPFDLNPHAFAVIDDLSGIVWRTNVEANFDNVTWLKSVALSLRRNPELVWTLGMCNFPVIDLPTVCL